MERRQAVATAEQLKRLIKPFFLRREKKEVLANDNSNSTADKEDETQEASESKKKTNGLPRKNDFIVWLPISKYFQYVSFLTCRAQQKIYELYLTTDEVKNVLNKTNSPLAGMLP